MRGARENNLKDVSLDISERELTVFTGVSGSGKVLATTKPLDLVARADWVIDLGPGAGHDGGQVIFEGPPAALAEAAHSLTGQHLRKRSPG